MAESSHRQQRLGARSAMGEVVEVSGGHIVRSTGRKDRHSKVCTAKGPRDRRVRLAAHTAIQFYDVQDRLGYDRPSKAVDWLIKKAQAAIDELAQLPPWHPTAALPEESDVPRPSSKRTAAAMAGGDDEEPTLRRRSIADNPNAQISSFLPLSMDSDSIADTIKSFFPLGASGESFTSSDLTPRSSSHPQDLKLSLQSQQDPLMLHHHTTDHNSQPPRVSQLLLTGTPFEYDAAAAAPTGWADHHHTPELSRFQRFASFGGGVDTSSTVSAISAFAPFYFNPPPPPQPLLQQLFGHNHHQLVSQRGPLQSSNTPSIRAWIDPSAGAAAGADPTYHHHHSSLSGSGFASGYGGFPGFHIPARIQGDEEEHDGYSDKPSSASSDSRH